MSTVIQVENLCKTYRLGSIGGGTFQEDFSRLWAKVRGRPDPTLQIGLEDHTRLKGQEFKALQNVSFEVKDGEILGVIGRNGAGKSTLLKILSRVTAPTSGEVRVKGRIASLLEVGTGFHPELTGRENIFLNGAILGMSKMEIRSKFDEIVAFSGVEEFIDTPVKRYSSGMYVRLAFAVAAHLEPEILIVDEVLAVGDAEFQSKCLGKMKEVSTAGRTVLFVSHNMHAVRNLCNRAILLHDGRLSAMGTAEVMTTHHLNRGEPLRNSSWTRDESAKTPSLYFRSARCELFGKQPDCGLTVTLGIHSARPHPNAFLAIDISNSIGEVIMQAIPTLESFIRYDGRLTSLKIDIDLPPLIPGTYRLELWMGPHNTETLDHVKNCISFDVAEAPTKNRSFPYTMDHGWIVPTSRIADVVPPAKESNGN